MSISITCAGNLKTVNTNKDKREIIDWDRATREGATREQLRRWSRLTLEQIIAAQEEMAELSRHIAETPAKKPSRK